MTDKEKYEALVSEIKRRHKEHKEKKSNYASTDHFWQEVENRELLSFIDSMQEEPIFKVGDTIQKKGNNSIRYSIINKTSDGYRALRGLSDTIVIWFSEQDQWELVEEPVSEDFDTLDQLLAKYAIDFSYKGKTLKECSDMYKAEIIASANHLEPVSEDFEKIVEEIAEPTILNAYGTKELARRLRNTMCGTSVSEELEKAVKNYFNNLDNIRGSVGEMVRNAYKAGAQWQKQQDQATIELAEDHAYFAGRTKTIDEIKEALLSEVLPCFMHGGEADEVVAKLDEVLNQKK